MPIRQDMRKIVDFFEKKCRKVCVCQKKAVILHTKCVRVRTINK